ncbi:MAG: sodium:proton antiporter [Elainellaceae cyanobacterium]
MSQLNIGLVTIALVVLVLGLVSKPIRESYVSSSIVALLIGVLISPPLLELLDVTKWGNQETIVEEAARLTLAIGLMGVALRIPKGYAPQHWRSLGVMLGLVMPLMWLSSGLLVWWLLGLPFWVAMLIGAVVTPTDPVVATDIVTGEVAKENIPARLRHLISTESGLNDGLAYPLVFLGILLLTRPTSEALSHWIIRTVVWEVGFAIVFGVALGYATGQFLKWAERKHFIGQQSFLSYTIALSLLALGGGKLLGTDGILAVFVAGLVFDGIASASEKSEEEQIQEAINRFFTLPIFVLLGLVLPWQEWWQLGWKGLALAIAVLLLRRLPAVLALRSLAHPLKTAADAWFVGWFGPIGVAALYYAHVSLRETNIREVWVVSSLLIVVSILAHGITATPFSKLYGKHYIDRGKPEKQQAALR